MNDRLHFNPYLELETQGVQCLVEGEKWVPIRFREMPYFSGGAEADI